MLWGGTWSDGKLVTRIGRNSSSVQAVMKTLVRFGAPDSILVDGKPVSLLIIITRVAEIQVQEGSEAGSSLPSFMFIYKFVD